MRYYRKNKKNKKLKKSYEGSDEDDSNDFAMDCELQESNNEEQRSVKKSNSYPIYDCMIVSSEDNNNSNNNTTRVLPIVPVTQTLEFFNFEGSQNNRPMNNIYSTPRLSMSANYASELNRLRENYLLNNPFSNNDNYHRRHSSTNQTTTHANFVSPSHNSLSYNANQDNLHLPPLRLADSAPSSPIDQTKITHTNSITLPITIDKLLN